jgi:hypothetical protein
VSAASDDFPTPLNDRLADAAADWQTLDGVAPSTMVGVFVGILRSATPGDLADWLEHHNLAWHAGCWDAPEVTDEQIESAEKDLAGWVDMLNDSEGDATVADECEQASEILRELKEARDRVTVYYEDDERPFGARPLYRIGGTNG